VVAKEADAVALIRERIAMGSIVHADEAGGWDRLHAYYDVMRINHSVAFSRDGACTNRAESYFSRLRRAELGQHHHISGKYLPAYAVEMAWREDGRRMPNGVQHHAATGAAPCRYGCSTMPLRVRRWRIRLAGFGQDIGSECGHSRPDYEV